MNMWLRMMPCCLFAGWLASGCAFMNDGTAKKLPSNMIATPASYYSTAKARYLGTKYMENLDRLSEKIVRNPGTSQLQFANNISSVGGIGFFTHSATKTPDERYLEVVLATPETFEAKGDYSDKVNRLFSRYGQDLLSIMAGDPDIFQDRELAGYGLNLNWRTVTAEGQGNRVSLARAIVYFSKERVAGFLRRSISQNELLGDAVIFAVEDDGPLQLVSYQPRENKPDFRPAIREDNLAAGTPAAKAASAAPVSTKLAKPAVQKPATKVEPVKKAEPPAQTPRERSQTEGPAVVTQTRQALSGGDPIPAAGTVTGKETSAVKPAQNKQDPKPENVVLAQPPVEAQLVARVPEGVIPMATAQKTAEPAQRKKEQSVAPAVAVPAVRTDPLKAPLDTTKEPSGIEKIAKGDETETIELPSKPSRMNTTVAEVAEPQPASAPVIVKSEEPKIAEIAATRPTIAKPAVPPVIERKVPASSSAATGPETRKLAAQTAAPKQMPRMPEKIVLAEPESNRQSPAPRGEVAPVAPVKTPMPPVARSTEPVKAPPVERPPEKSIGDAEKPVIAKAAESVTTIPVAEPVIITRNIPLGGTQSSPVSRAESTPAEQNAVLPPAQKAADPGVAAKTGGVKSTVATKAEPDRVPPAAAAEPVPANEKKHSAPPTTGEQLALLSKPAAPAIERVPLARPAAKPLQGFIIQVAFHDKQKAMSWAEKMTQRGYAVSLTEAGPEGALRVRLGNFPVRDEAERQLQSFKQEGMSGIIINLPQAFRPDARSSLP